MLFWQKSPPDPFVIERREWTAEDDADMREIMSFPQGRKLIHLLHGRIASLTERLIDGEETKPQIKEIRDLILQLQNYADPQ